MDPTEGLAFEYATERIGQSRIVHADCLEWLSRLPENTLHAVVTDPPYGVKEYDLDQLEKRANGKGGDLAHPAVVRWAHPCPTATLYGFESRRAQTIGQVLP